MKFCLVRLIGCAYGQSSEGIVERKEGSAEIQKPVRRHMGRSGREAEVDGCCVEEGKEARRLLDR